jgi:hypothetical protein
MNTAVGLRLRAGSTPRIGTPRGPCGSIRTEWAASLIRRDDYSLEWGPITRALQQSSV